MRHEDVYLKDCLCKIESHLNWGPGEQWTTNDFRALSEKIHGTTGTHLSVATLKRLWGTIDYSSKPTATTLNALAQYLGHENWKAFQFSHPSVNGDQPTATTSKKPKRGSFLAVGLMAVAVLVMAGLIYFFSQMEDMEPATDHYAASNYSFSSKKAVSEGVPNSVIFDFDASAAWENDTIFIQQTWDKKLREKVARNQTVHTSIYYHPGYFHAKLVINDSIVKQHPLYITTTGWLPLAEQEKVPVYFKPQEAIAEDGTLALPIDLIRQNNIPLQPETPWVSFYNVREFAGVMSDNFVFETELKNDFHEGAGVCQHTEIHILLKGGAIIIPLAIKGCVSGLAIYDMDGMVPDPTPLGVDFSDWAKVRYVVKDKVGSLYINEKLAYDSLNLNFGPVDIVGLRYRFQGTGSIKSVRLLHPEDNVVYEEPAGSK